MKKTILFIFRKHISTTNSKLDLPVYRIASRYYTTSFVAEISEDTVFHTKEKKKTSLRTVVSYPCAEVKKNFQPFPENPK